MCSDRRIVDLWAEFEAMPERQLFDRLLTFQYSLSIFEGNYRELRNILLWQATSPDAKELWYLPNRQLLHTFMEEVTRLLHNFAAAAKSLVDHTTRHHRHLYEGSDRFPEYRQEVRTRFAANPLAKFVMGLRTYCQHYQIPPVVSVLSPSGEGSDYCSKVLLDTGKLREFSGWSAPAKQFLNSAGETVDLLAAIEEYHATVVDFYRWFQGRQRDIHAPELKRLAEKRREIESLDISETLRAVLAAYPDGPWDPDDYFRHILSPAQWQEVTSYPRNSAERCDKLIAFIEARAQISDDLKSQIRRLYRVG